MFADDAIVFSYKHATPEGIITLAVIATGLVVLAVWMVLSARNK